MIIFCILLIILLEIIIKDGEFKWDIESEESTIKNINIDVINK